jgi:hypothetical protein
MRIEANLNNVKEIEALPGGVYSAFIPEEPKLIESKEKKTPGLQFTFKLTDPGTEIAPGVPRTIKHTIWKSAEMGWEHFRMREVCEACGVALENPDTADFVGANLKLAIAVESYESSNGEPRTRNVVDHFLKP